MRSWQVWEPRPIPSCALSTTVSSRRLAPTQDAGEAEGPRPSFRAGGAGQPFQETGPQGLTARGQLGRGGAEVGREPVSRHAVVGEVTRARAEWGLFWQCLRLALFMFIQISASVLLCLPAGL